MRDEKNSEIWAIGGGKGGTGKTFIISSVGTYLAKKEHKIVLIDADIGGANLHSFLGIDKPKKSISSFFEKGISLNKLQEKTGMTNMSVITGDVNSLSSDRIRYSQKLKLLRQIKNLNSQYVLIDLGAGSHYNTIDIFLIADKMIAVLDPELVSVENLYHFIKNVLFRKLRMTLRDYGFREFIEHVWARRERYKIKTLWDLISWLKESFSFIGEIIDRELSDFKVYLIVNKVRNREDIYMGSFIKSAFIKYLGINTQYTGYIQYDDSVWKSVRDKRPFMQHFASSNCAQEIEILAENLIKGEEVKLP